MTQELHRIILLGPPGSGKGTQAMLLSRDLNIPQISTGDILREEINIGSSIGMAAGQIVSSGQLVPDNIVIEIVKKRLIADDCQQGFILDGFPRTLAQAQAIDTHQIGIDQALFLDVVDALILKRLSGRRVCSKCNSMFHVHYNPPKQVGICDRCGGDLVIRKDDEESTIRKRIAVYHQQTAPVIEYYQKHPSICCHRIDAGSTDLDTPETIAARIRDVLYQEQTR
ncbi:adenylate kinase [bacterium]|nr:adenylate kinase [candidate division CSSED10-310 bacterium]